MTNPTPPTTPPQPDVKPTPQRFADCPQTTKAMRKGADCKPDHLYVTADFSDSLERQLSDHAQLLDEKDAEIARLNKENAVNEARLEKEGAISDAYHRGRSHELTEGEWEEKLTHATREVERLTRCLNILPADWMEDASLETWFPMTAKELSSLRAANAELIGELTAAEEERDHKDLAFRGALNEIGELRDSLTAAQQQAAEDKADLDWLDKESRGYPTLLSVEADYRDGHRAGSDWFVITTGVGSGPNHKIYKGSVTLRSAIRAARAGTEQAGKGEA